LALVLIVMTSVLGCTYIWYCLYLFFQTISYVHANYCVLLL